jgi:hypothetical protein
MLVSHTSEYFKQHPHFAGGLYSAPLIVIIAMDPTPMTMSVGSKDRGEMVQMDRKEPTSIRERHHANENKSTITLSRSGVKAD